MSMLALTGTHNLTLPGNEETSHAADNEVNPGHRVVLAWLVSDDELRRGRR